MEVEEMRLERDVSALLASGGDNKAIKKQLLQQKDELKRFQKAFSTFQLTQKETDLEHQKSLTSLNTTLRKTKLQLKEKESELSKEIQQNRAF